LASRLATAAQPCAAIGASTMVRGITSPPCDRRVAGCGCSLMVDRPAQHRARLATSAIAMGEKQHGGTTHTLCWVQKSTTSVQPIPPSAAGLTNCASRTLFAILPHLTDQRHPSPLMVRPLRCITLTMVRQAPAQALSVIHRLRLAGRAMADASMAAPLLARNM